MNLESKTDQELIEGIQAGQRQDEYLHELSSRHSGAYYSMVSRFFPEGKETPSSIDKELVFGSKDLVIFKSAISFDKTKGTKFVTHLCNNARFFCLYQINRAKDTINYESSDFENIFAEDDEQNISEKVDSALLKQVLGVIDGECDQRVRKLFQMRYFSGDKVTPWIKIYKHIPRARNPNAHLTIQGCINLHDKTVDLIKKRVKKMAIHVE